jgi:hypothetical protein
MNERVDSAVHYNIGHYKANQMRLLHKIEILYFERI